MSTGRFLRFGLCLAAVAALLLLVVAARPAAAVSGGSARWASLAGDGVGPNDIAGPDDHPVVSFSTAGAVGPSCIDGMDLQYGVGDMALYWPNFDCWLPWFDAEGSGLPAGADINALHDECGPDEPRCDTYVVFAKPLVVPGLGKVQPHDIIGAEWMEGTQDVYGNFWLVFDGSDVGLTTAGERTDALFLFDEDRPAPYGDCVQLGLGSTVGNYRVRDQWGGWLTGGGEDVLGFCATNLGTDTTGLWHMVVDGSAQGMPRNSTDSLSMSADGNTLYLTTKKNFNVDAAAGGHSMVYAYDMTTEMFSGPVFDAPANGLPKQVDALEIVELP